MLIQQQQTQDTPLAPVAASFEAAYIASLSQETSFTDGGQAFAPDDLNALNDMEQEMVDVARLRRKLPRRSFLRHASLDWHAERHNGEEQAGRLTDAKFAALRNKLRDPAPAAWRERTLCAWLLGHAALNEAQTTQAALALADVLQKRHASRARRVRANLGHIARKTLPFAALYTVLLIAQTIHEAIRNNPQAYQILNVRWDIGLGALVELGLSIVPMFLIIVVGLTAALTSLMFPWLTALNAERNNQARIVAALSLSRLRLASSVEDLCRAALDTNANVRRASENALLTCLPTLAPDHYGRVRADTSPLLCALLNNKKERLFANHHSTERLVLAVLDALGKVGSGDAAPHVARVAQDGWTDAVREQAAAVLPILEERQRQASDPHLLLRASHLPPDNGTQLMRPAADSRADTPEQLLRASMSQ